jgi:hypothetical protein
VTAHVYRNCQECSIRAGQQREQWAEESSGVPVIITAWTCTDCGTEEHVHDPFPIPNDTQPTTHE